MKVLHHDEHQISASVGAGGHHDSGQSFEALNLQCRQNNYCRKAIHHLLRPGQGRWRLRPLQTSFDGCIAACGADATCQTAQYHENNGYCYLKNSVNGAIQASGEDTVDLGSVCQQSTTVTVSGMQCSISCGVDRRGGDMSNTRTGNYLACAQACADNSNCVTAQYNERNGYCYLKNQLNPASDSTDTDTIVCDRPKKAAGDSCSQGADCQSGQCTSTSLCGPLPNDYYQCKVDSECQSGYCKPVYQGASYGFCTIDSRQNIGATCVYNSDCKSKKCTSTNYCGPVRDGTLCGQDSECQSNFSNAPYASQNYGFCGQPPLISTGAALDSCRSNSQCASNQCLGRYCGPYPAGTRCENDSWCLSGSCAFNPSYGATVCQ